MDVNQQIHEMARSLLYFMDRQYVDHLITIAGYLILAKVADIIIGKLLKRLAELTNVSCDDEVIAFIHRPVFLTIIFLGVLHVVMAADVRSPWDFIAPGIVKTLIFLSWWLPFVKLLAGTNLREDSLIARKTSMPRELLYLFRNLVRITVLGLGVVAVLLIWHVNLTPLFASAGIAGLAVAIAAKDSLANFFGGMSVLIDRPYRISDYIILDSGERGEVVDIGLRSTRIKTRDDVLITIPNSVMANAKIINESAPLARFRIRVPVGVAYGSDLNRVEELLVKIAHDNSNVTPLPEPRARVRRFGSFSIDFELLCWVRDPRFKGRVIHQLLKTIDEAFKEEGIVIPYPQHEVHIKSGGISVN